MEFLRDHATELGVQEADLKELSVIDRYPSPSGIEHVYLRQLLQGTPVYNAGAAVHFRDGRVVHHLAWLEPDLAARAVVNVPKLTLAEAFHDGFPPAGAVLEEGELVYYPLPESREIRLCWQLTIDDREAGIHYLSIIDAANAFPYYRKELTISCHFPESGRRSAGSKPSHPRDSPPVKPGGDGAMYYVFPFGLESPRDGDRQLLFEPSDDEASPFGWHDTDGRTGAEHTITRGNNAYAYRDADEIRNEPDSGFVADGGDRLDFDFPFSVDGSPESVLEASLTQLFYNTNVLHDWAYAHGFDERAGNFQENNYGRGGRGQDPVLAEAQDGSSSNNATFYTPKDGKPGRMQMFLWRGRTELLEVRYPASVAGRFPSTNAAFGPQLTKAPFTGELAIGLDGSDQPELGCGPLTNADHVKGKIVILERGDCPFQVKAYNAEQAGAKAVIICNPANDLFTMAGMENGQDYPVTIPVILLRQVDCEPLKEALFAAETVRIALADYSRAPIDGSFDNGIVAHEYGHGISNRIIGGPNNNLCLLNDEQMGEGWSDFFLLASTPRSAYPLPSGRESRSVGAYSTAGPTGARGFRTQFYSTDPSINTLTYDNVITAAIPHGLGEVWAATLWDMYWAMVDRYGYDEDLIHGEGGNNRAVRLVIEAMKFTPCSPGLLDGRDALLVADRLENGGVDACLLWEIFQRRGMGLSAEQGDSKVHNDSQEAFDANPSCLFTLKINKTARRDFVRPGDSVTFTLTVRNDKPERVTQVSVTDEVPPGMTVDLSRVSGPSGFLLDNGKLTFAFPEIESGEQKRIEYTVATDSTWTSTRLFGDGAEDGGANWTTVSRQGTSGWRRTGYSAFSGDSVWQVVNVSSAQDHSLQTAHPIRIVGTAPVLRFFTRYDTEPAFDAGIVEISTDGGISWEGVEDKFVRHDYRGKISDGGAVTLKGKQSFWGNSNGYREVIIDLKAYWGQTLLFRWRFVSDEDVGAAGWWVDQVEVLPSIVAYGGAAHVTSFEGDRDSSRIRAPGIVVNYLNDETVGLFPSNISNPTLTIFPNPAATRLNLRLLGRHAGPARLRLVSAAGHLVLTETVQLTAAWQELPVDITGLPVGSYTLILTEQAVQTAIPLVVVR